MEIALVALAGIGLLLFLYSFLAYIFAGFKHHPVTGLISMLPALNIVTLPSLWHVTGRTLVIGFVGLIIAAGGWMMGAEQGFNHLLAKAQGKPGEMIASTEQTTQEQALDESKLQNLPGKALYKMAFKPVKPTQLVTLQDKTIQIVTKNREQFEGRLLKIINTEVIIESARDNEESVALDQIDELSVMFKQKI